MSKKSVNVILTLFTLISMSVIVFAEVENVGGERWVYGVTGFLNHGDCYSNYHHPTLYHGSTAINGNGKTSVPNYVKPGDTSEAKVNRTPMDNTAYWHRCNIDKECGGPYNR